jgi:uncharacterized protein (TIGR01777 family)
MKRKILIAGGTGFIGQALTAELLERGYEVIILTRGQAKEEEGVRYLNWDGKTLGDWAQEFEGAQAIVNMAGRSVDCRYNEANKKEILDSRIDAVKVVNQAILNCHTPPAVVMQTGTLAIYGDAPDKICAEGTEVGEGFSPSVGKAWEKSFFEVKLPQTRQIFFRISFVLGKNGGALKAMAQLTRFFMGGASGPGDQYMSWLHMEDLALMIIWGIEKEKMRGIFHATSLRPVTNQHFMKTLRRVLNRPWSPRLPAWMVKIGTFFMKTEAELILRSRFCLPLRFIEMGFPFKHSNLKEAMSDLLKAEA